MAWNSRKQLRKVFDKELSTFTRQEVLTLAERLQKSGPAGAKAYLHAVRGGAIALLQLGSRTRARDLKQFGEDHRLLMRWAVVAWAARALIWIETLERAHAELDGPGWSGETALHLVDAFEGEEFWLWPFPYEGPFPGDDDEEDEEL